MTMRFYEWLSQKRSDIRFTPAQCDLVKAHFTSKYAVDIDPEEEKLVQVMRLINQFYKEEEKRDADTE